ncbi:MAG: hypothetical protein KHY79_02020 [Clostridiales bacterium]|nr:hypothetical protein [Clostridiales bacterium]
MKKKYLNKFIAAGLASSMLFGSQIVSFAAEPSGARFTAKDGVIDEQPGDVYSMKFLCVLFAIQTGILSGISKVWKKWFLTLLI